MLSLPFRRACRNPIFLGGLATFRQQDQRWSHALNYVAVLALVLFVTWPKEGFLNIRDLPFTYNALGGSAMIILAYLNFSGGARKFIGSGSLSWRDWLTLAPISGHTFLRGYLAAHFLDLLFFWGLSVPLVVLAASAAGEALHHLGAGLLILLVCNSCYRIIGVTLLTFFERDEFLLYILVRLFYVAFILISGFIAPVWNAVLAFADASIWPRRLVPLQLPGMALRGWVATLACHLLLAGLFFIIASWRVSSIQRRARRQSAAEEGARHV